MKETLLVKTHRQLLINSVKMRNLSASEQREGANVAKCGQMNEEESLVVPYDVRMIISNSLSFYTSQMVIKSIL